VIFLNVFIVFAHPEPESLNGALKDLAVLTLEENGNKVKVSDLYGMGFKATLDKDDFLKMQTPNRLMPVLEQLNASKTDGFASDIKAEWKKLNGQILLYSNFLSGMKQCRHY
jgi:NAD(P)H dehydrogenase (quinone)